MNVNTTMTVRGTQGGGLKDFFDIFKLLPWWENEHFYFLFELMSDFHAKEHGNTLHADDSEKDASQWKEQQIKTIV